MTVRRLRWISVVVPLAGLVALDYVRLEVLGDGSLRLPALLGFYLIVAGGVVAFSFAVFGLIGRLQSRTEQQNRQLLALNQIAAASSRDLELQGLLDLALDSVLRVMDTDGGVICLLDEESEELVASCYRGISDELAARIRRQKLSEDPVGSQVVRTGRPVVLEDIMNQPLVAEEARREGFNSAVSAPLKSEGKTVGVLAVATRQSHHFTETELELLTSIGGQLGLAVRNSVLFQQAQQRNQELVALLAVTEAVSSALDLSELLDRALEAVLQVTSADTAGIWLVDDRGELVLERQQGLHTEGFRDSARLRLGEGLPGIAFESGQPVFVQGLGSDDRLVRRPGIELGLESFGAFPMYNRGEIAGVLAVASRDRLGISSKREHRLLEAIGEQLAVAIENARLQRRVLDVAVLEERERIARELHDGLAQVLGYINTQTQAIRKLLNDGAWAPAQQSLSAMEEAAREVYADVREAILGLRGLSPQPDGAIASLKAYAQRYRDMTGLHVVIRDRTNGGTPRLPAASEIQLMRIIQEALTNVRKHAGARNIVVDLSLSGTSLTVRVEDDGEGFAAASAGKTGWPHFGLQTMRERAEAVGGSFEVVSEPGRGTKVIVCVPIMMEGARQ